ncbi:MAG: RNA-binding S4 domain-containing protein [Saprospiraceae bacterium]|nr:RNA-binding S4 domain-containing protein [Saprospiraceae bacterium]
MLKTRVDKWLWAVRIFKSRTIATDHCKSGKVSVNGHKMKPSGTITINDQVSVQKNGYTFIFQVVKLLEKRVSAPIAQEAYKDLTPEEELNKYESWYIGKGKSEIRDRGAGRPTKKERRDLDIFKDDYYFPD